MIEMNKNETVIKRVIQSLLPILNKNVLVLFTGGTADAPGYQQMIDDLLLTEARIAVTTAFQKIVSRGNTEWMEHRIVKDEFELYQTLDNTDLIVIPVLTRNTLAKGAMGIQDNLVTMAIAKGFMMGIPVMAVKENCDPNSKHSIEKKINKNLLYNQMLLEYEEKWRKFGAALINPEEFVPSLKQILYSEIQTYVQQAAEEAVAPMKANFQAAKIITAGEARLMTNGQNIRISARTVVTPLAQEIMDEKKVVVKIV